MGKIGWYNDNANRSYPFVKGTVDAQPPAVPKTIADLPDGIIVDAGFLMGLKSAFDHELHEAYLHEIRREGSMFFLEFRSDAPGLFERPLIFTREVGDPDYQLEFVDNLNEPVTSESESGFSASGSGEPCGPEPLWSGFVVTGKLSALEELLPADDAVVRLATTDGLIEPALIQSLVQSYVDSLSVANNDRTRVTAAENCDEVTWPHPTDIVFVRDECVRGDVRLKAGFNAVIQQNPFDNLITIGAITGAGEGEVCEQVPLFDGESPPDDSVLLEGGPLCNEAVRSINGVGGRLLDIMAGLGAVVTPDPENNKVIVNMDMTGLALCFVSDVSEVSESI
jgi:hypothetical protein